MQIDVPKEPVNQEGGERQLTEDFHDPAHGGWCSPSECRREPHLLSQVDPKAKFKRSAEREPLCRIVREIAIHAKPRGKADEEQGLQGDPWGPIDQAGEPGINRIERENQTNEPCRREPATQSASKNTEPRYGESTFHPILWEVVPMEHQPHGKREC